MPDQAGDPLGILAVGLMPAEIAHVVGIADHHRHMAFQGGVDRDPIDARGLHAHGLASSGQEPIPEFPETLEVGGEVAFRVMGAALWARSDEASGDDSGVNIQPAGDGMDDIGDNSIHGPSFLEEGCPKLGSERTRHCLPCFPLWEATFRGTNTQAGQTNDRSSASHRRCGIYLGHPT